MYKAFLKSPDYGPGVYLKITTNNGLELEQVSYLITHANGDIISHCFTLNLNKDCFDCGDAQADLSLQ